MKQIIIDNISTSYFITESGQCYNSYNKKYLIGQVGKNGYFSYNLTLPDGSKRRMYAHRLVANAYIPNTDINKNQINHKDGNKLNNKIENLEWVSQSENQQHAIQNELRKYSHIFCFTPEKQLVAEYKNIAEASKSVKIATSIISQEINKQVKTLSGGFYWSNSPILGKTKDYLNLGKSKIVYQYDIDGKYITSYMSTGIAAKAINGNSGHISECCRGKIKSYKNFIWKYADDIVSTSGESQRG